jgi:hypothetical protein
MDFGKPWTVIIASPGEEAVGATLATVEAGGNVGDVRVHSQKEVEA